MRTLKKTIITCAVTGAIHLPTMTPHLPITPKEIANEAVAAAEAGASIIHLHVRDPETGEPITDLEIFKEISSQINNKTNAIVQPTTGGAPTMPIDKRIQVVPHLKPEMASCNMGSINFGLYQILNDYDEFDYDWEREYLEKTRDLIFSNTFESLEHTLPTFDKHGTKPELECYDIAHLYNAKHFLDQGLLEPPLHLQFVLGVHGGIGADVENLQYMYRVAEKLFGDSYSFSVIGAGKYQFPLGVQAISMGGNARVGLEDNIYLRKGQLAKSNAEQVKKISDLSKEITGREVADPAEVRDFLELKGPHKVAF